MRSGYLRVWYKALFTEAPFCFDSTPQQCLAATLAATLATTLAFRQKPSLYNYFFYFQVGVFHKRPLINLQQINFTHCCSLLPQQRIPVPATRGRGHLPPYNFCFDCYNWVLPSSSFITFLSILISVGGELFSSCDAYVIRLLPKLTQNFPFLKVWFFPMANGLHLADSFHNPISFSSLFWLVITQTLTFPSLSLSLLQTSFSLTQQPFLRNQATASVSPCSWATTLLGLASTLRGHIDPPG